MVAFFPTLPNTKEKMFEKAWELGSYGALLFTDVKSLMGNDKYPYVLEVRGPFPESQGVTLYVVSEPGTPTNYLCAINDSGRMNFGCSDDWKIKEKFVAQALKAATELLKVETPAKEISVPTSQKSQSGTSIYKWLPLLPILLAFLVAPFDHVSRKFGVRTLDGWALIFSAGGDRDLQINATIWVVQLAIGAAMGFAIAKLMK